MQKTYLITGGTGSFGTAVLKRLLKENDFTEIRVFSRDDKKHGEMRQIYTDPRIKYYMGDIKDRDSIDSAMYGVDYVFHAAALKTVSSCENNPIESVKTNVLGSYNVLQSAIDHKIKKIVLLSTDKVIYPISVMGASKLLMEKIAASLIQDAKETEIVVTRFGNIINSSGSVTELFLNKIKKNQDIVITGKNMTRFMMTIDQAIDLVFYAFEKGEHGATYVSKMPSFYIENIAKAFIELNASNTQIEYVEAKNGDKVNERLVTIEEEDFLIDEGNFYKITNQKRHRLITYGSSDNPCSLEETVKMFAGIIGE
jgi:UDP-glucose 4-epimerase